MVHRRAAWRPALALLAALGACGLGACSEDEKPTEPMAVPADVIVRPARHTLTAGGKVQLAAQVNDASGKPIGGAEINFKSSNTALVSVNANGLVRSLGPTGTAVVTVSSARQKEKMSVTVVHGVAAVLKLQSGDGQSTQVTKALNEALTVKVTDRAGNPVGGSVVTFRVTTGGGQVTPATVTVDHNGLAKTYWTSGPKAGVQVVMASSPGLDGSPATFSANAVPGPPTTMTPIGGAPRKVTAGETVPLRVRLVDEHGNPSSTVDVVWAVRIGRGTLKPERGRPDSAGTAETRWEPTLAGPSEVIVSAGNVKGSPFAFRTEVVPGPPAQVAIVSGDKQITRVGRPVSSPLVVRVTDRFENAVRGAAVSFIAKPGEGAIAQQQAVSDAEGLVSAGGWTLGRSGFNVLVAKLPGDQAASVEFVAVAPARVTVAGLGRVPRGLRRISALPAAAPTPQIDKPLSAPLKVTPGGRTLRPGSACKALPPGSLTGAIAVASAGACAATEMEAHLAGAGAVAALVFHPRARDAVVMDGFAGKIPVLMLARDDALALLEWLKDQRSRARAAAKAGGAVPKAGARVVRKAADAGVRARVGLTDGGRAPPGLNGDGGPAVARKPISEPMATISPVN